MRRTGEATVYLEKGEPVPVLCRCGEMYQPPVDSEVSECPECCRVNVHGVCPEFELLTEGAQ